MKELVFHRWYLPFAARWPDAPAYANLGAEPVAYGAHVERTFRLADAVRSQLGVHRGDRVGVLATNSTTYVELFHAALLGAFIITPLNNRFAPNELAHVLRDSGAKVVFADAVFAGTIDRVRSASDIDCVVLVGQETSDAPHDVRYEDLLASGRADVPPETEEADPCLLMYTGGTTGHPKGVLSTQRAQILNAMHFNAASPMAARDVVLATIPMFHAATMPFIVNPQETASVVHIMQSFDALKALEAIERLQVTWMIAVPTVLGMMLNHPQFRASMVRSLRMLGYGASPMPEQVLKAIRNAAPGIRLVQGYGMTEATGYVTVLGPDDHDRGGHILRSAGRSVAGVRVATVAPDGSRLPPGETGEVVIQGGNVMERYWNQPELTDSALRDGWFHTGDAGYIDDGGYLYLVDRVKDMIISGGENVYSAEVERALMKHPAVMQAAVIGIPSEKWGEAVHAIVVLREGHSPSEAELIGHARQWIADYKVPKSIEFRVDPLPLSAVMKVLKRDLRAPHWEGRDRCVN